MVVQKHPAVFITGIGWPLRDGCPREMRAADADGCVRREEHPPAGLAGGSALPQIVWLGPVEAGLEEPQVARLVCHDEPFR